MNGWAGRIADSPEMPAPVVADTAEFYHVSEQSGISRFDPRPVPREIPAVDSPVVWAVDESHLCNYLLPGDCPRVTFRAGPGTTEEDIGKLLRADRSLRIVAVEADWMPAIRAVQLSLYRFDTSGFEIQDPVAGYYVSSETATPIKEIIVTDLIEAISSRGVELRVLDSLWELRELVIGSTLEYSIIRMNTPGLHQPGWSYGIHFRSIRMNPSERLRMNRLPLVAILLLSAEGLTDDPVTGEPPAGVYFGFTDSSGELILIHSPELIELPEQLFAVLPSGDLAELDFIEYREEGQDNSHRQTVYSFQNLPGYLFRLPGGQVAGGRTVFLADAGFLGDRILLPVTGHPPVPLEDDLVARIEDARSSPVAESWNLAGIEGGISVVMVRFEPGDSTNVASLALIDGERMVFEEYIGGPMNDCTVWRVDDGGVFDAAFFEVIAAFRTSDGVEIVRTWIGAEGESAALLEENGPVFREVLGGYRYWAPL